MRAVHGDAAEWGATEHLLAVAADRLGVLAWQNGDPKKQPKPKPLPRPGDKRSHRSKLTPAEMARRLAAHKERTRR